MRSAELFARILVPAFLVAVAGCGGPPPEEGGREAQVAGDGVLAVYAVNYPLQYFAQRIGGDRVSVAFPAPPDVDPAYWTPDAETVGAYQRADLVLLNGAGYAGWVAQASLPPSRLVDTSAAFRERYVAVDAAVTHAHGPEGEHAHGDVAFTTWLDLELAAEHARAIAAAFDRTMPEGGASFKVGLEGLEADLLQLDAALGEVAARGAPTLLGSHPVYQYLAQGYGLDIRSVHFEPDEFPGAAAWADLDRLLAEKGAAWMLWEGPPLERTVRALERRGVSSLVFDPCGNVPAEGDFLSVQRANLRALEAVVR